MSDYKTFLDRKTHIKNEHGFAPVWMPDLLFPFQQSLTEWAIQKGRAAIFADCGLGKTLMQLTWAENVARKTGGRVLILTPLAVSFQTVREGEKIGVEVAHRREGIKPGDRIVVTNYERLHYFNEDDFQGVVCDESSILKNFDGKTKDAVTDFMRKRPYRLLCTATAAPNDYIELGTSSEALGVMGYIDMLKSFFKSADNTYAHGGSGGAGARRFNKNPFGGKFRFRGHAERDFWRWVCSWARAMRKPSDLGFDDGEFRLTDLNVNEHFVESRIKPEGYLFDIPAFGLKEERDELKRTVPERCEMAAALINAHKRPAIAWCHLNNEGHLLEKLIPDAVEIEGSDTEEKKEETFNALASGQIRVLVTKPKIAGFGLNWQHCANQVYFPSHSYEQYYQAVRRCWRYGQKNPVTVDLIATEGQALVLDNLKRKMVAAEKMFEQLVALMRDELEIKRVNDYTKKERVPTWL
mgnify:FL=1